MSNRPLLRHTFHGVLFLLSLSDKPSGWQRRANSAVLVSIVFILCLVAILVGSGDSFVVAISYSTAWPRPLARQSCYYCIFLSEYPRIFVNVDSPWYYCSAVLFVAYAMDYILGEAKRWHPLVGFGTLAMGLERRLNTIKQQPAWYQCLLGVSAWMLLVLPLPLVLVFTRPYLYEVYVFGVDCVLVYLALGLNSLTQHGMQVYRPLEEKNLPSARHFTGYLVSRDTASLSVDQMSRATTESMLENGHDAVIASFVAFIIGGAPLVIVHRLANTLDAMWGYKTPRFLYFGWASARMDDALGFLSAKMCSVLYALQGRFFLCMRNARKQGNKYKSHNGGWVMASGATALNIRLGGIANYNGRQCISPELGQGYAVCAEDILRSINLVRRAALGFIFFVFIIESTMRAFNYFF